MKAAAEPARRERAASFIVGFDCTGRNRYQGYGEGGEQRAAGKDHAQQKSEPPSRVDGVKARDLKRRKVDQVHYA